MVEVPPGDGSEALKATRAVCRSCGRPTFDPAKRDRPWVRAVSGGVQVLVCPSCQAEHEDWADGLDHCATCGSTRLSAVLDEVVCRACGAVQSERDDGGAHGIGITHP